LAAAEPQEKQFAREGVHPQVPGAAPEAARFAGKGVHSKGEGPLSPGVGPEAARCGGGGVVNLGEGPQLPGTGQFAGRGGIGAEGDNSVRGLKEALRGALVDPVFAGGDVVVIQEESGQTRSFQVGRPPLARSSRGAVYAVKALDTPKGRAAILRHGQWSMDWGEKHLFRDAHRGAGAVGRPTGPPCRYLQGRRLPTGGRTRSRGEAGVGCSGIGRREEPATGLFGRIRRVPAGGKSELPAPVAVGSRHSAARPLAE
jgi:hypothetical protein